MGITCVCLTLEEDAGCGMGQLGLQLPLTSLLGNRQSQAGRGSDHIEQGDSGHRSPAVFLQLFICFL